MALFLIFYSFSSTPPSPGHDNQELSTSPLIIKTTAEMGFQVPLGLIINEMRTSPEQSLVIEAGADQAFLDTSSDLCGTSIQYSNVKFESKTVMNLLIAEDPNFELYASFRHFQSGLAINF